MDNYPIGAARDPRAPYNEPEEREVTVRIETTLVKETTLFLDEGDDYKVNWWKDEIEDSTIATILVECEKIVNRLRQRGHVRYAGVNLHDLQNDCHSWSEGKLNAEVV